MLVDSRNDYHRPLGSCMTSRPDMRFISTTGGVSYKFKPRNTSELDMQKQNGVAWNRFLAQQGWRVELPATLRCSNSSPDPVR
jgi:hypothetical protein